MQTVEILVTQSNIDGHFIYAYPGYEVDGFFPADIDDGSEIELEVIDRNPSEKQVIQTGVFNRRVFKERGFVKTFFSRHNISAGDKLVLEKIAQRFYRLKSAKLIVQNSILADKAKRLEPLLLSAVSEILDSNIAILSAKRRKTQFLDDYGRTKSNDDQWMKELDYFLREVMFAELEQRQLKAHIPTLEANLLMNEAERAEVSEWIAEHRRIDGFYRNLIVRKTLDAVYVAIDRSSKLAAINFGSDGVKFEMHCLRELTTAGWVVTPTSTTGDQGVDLVAIRNDIIAVFQCKLSSNPIGNGAVQEVHAGRSIYHAQMAVVVSNSEYTIGARTAALHTGVILLHYTQLSKFGED